ncbi:aldehyde dehydrogenase family protein [Caballeronia sp. NK8]|uniref:aldehyde dehydrogenase family protein n=1 Tax=Caballeronia sp. NK8 TaxID=140098 RepID=UPI001BB62A5B|nr:aldehyde dehydrogenase [Caballeronia sp. NK8]BCQ22382.1 aldehyde dehydrogenase family protein [Caballeronia sp. NK8]
MSDGPNDALELDAPAAVGRAASRAVRCFDVLSPYDETVVGRALDVDFSTLALRLDKGSRAARALRNTLPVQQRFRKWATKIDARRDELARIISLETGKPIRFARVEVATALAALDACVSCPPISLVRDWIAAHAAYSIANWCDPVLSTVREVATVLSSGRALVIKPSSRAPSAPSALAALWCEGDELDALFCVGPSTDPVGMLRTAVMSWQVTEVRFQGSRDVGTFVSNVCDEAVVPVSISKSERLPLVVHAGADIQATCDALINRAILQPLLTFPGRISCLYIHDSVADSFISALVDKLSCLHVGNPLDDETDIGPVIDDVATGLISEQVEDALFDGAMLRCGKTHPDGRLIRPIVIDHAKPSMRVCVEELEGPLLPVVRFHQFSELPNTTCLTVDSLNLLDTGERFEP